MDTMEITKLVGGFCGSLLVFLLISTAAEMIYETESETVAYSVEVPEEAPAEDGEAEDAEPAEEVDVAALVAEADPAAGESAFRRCAACHNLADGAGGVGPHLAGLVGREIASVEGFGYSDALTGLEGAWTEQEIYAFIADPDGYAPGTIMNFAGLADSADRANVIAYIASAGQ